MFHIAFTPDYSPSNALSAQHETLIGAIAELLKSLDVVFGPEEWYVQHVLLACHDAVKNMMEDKTAKASWTDMGMEDASEGFDADLQTVMVVVDQMASQDWFFVQLAKDLATAK